MAEKSPKPRKTKSTDVLSIRLPVALKEIVFDEARRRGMAGSNLGEQIISQWIKEAGLWPGELS